MSIIGKIMGIAEKIMLNFTSIMASPLPLPPSGSYAYVHIHGIEGAIGIHLERSVIFLCYKILNLQLTLKHSVILV